MSQAVVLKQKFLTYATTSLASGLSNPNHSLVRKAVINGKERPFLKVLLRYCICKNGTTDGWVNGQTQGQHSVLKHSYGQTVELFKSLC